MKRSSEAAELASAAGGPEVRIGASGGGDQPCGALEKKFPARLAT